MKKPLLYLAFLLLLAFPCHVFADETVLHRGNSNEISTLDIHLADSLYDFNVILDMFEGLIAYGPDGTSVPGVAEKWDISEDGIKYTFYLRENAKWSNGDSVIAQDFLTGFKKALNPESGGPYAFLLYPIKNAKAINTGDIKDINQLGVKALDEKTLEIELEAPTSYFISLLANPQAGPVPTKVYEKYGKEWSKPKNIVSNGAYKMVQWRLQEFIEIEKNVHFHDADNVKIDRVFFYPTENKDAALRQFRAGELDIQEIAPLDKIQWIEKNLPGVLQIAPTMGLDYFAINTEKKPFDDIRVRRALSMSINRDVITSKVLKSSEKSAYSIAVLGVGEYENVFPDYKDWSQEKRDQEAQKLMNEAGFNKENPLEFTLKYNNSDNNAKVAIAVAQMWKKKLGVKATLINAETAIHYQDLKKQQFDLGRLGWYADYNDVHGYLTLFETKSKNYNFGRYSNPEYDRIMEQTSLITDKKERLSLLQKAETIALKEQAVIPVYMRAAAPLVALYVKGWQDSPKEVHLTRYLWIEK